MIGLTILTACAFVALGRPQVSVAIVAGMLVYLSA